MGPGSMLVGVYTLRHDDADWPADLPRTIASYDKLADALSALDQALIRHRTQVSACGDGPAVLQLAVVDDSGASIACAVHDGRAPTAEHWSSPDTWPH